MKRSDLITVFAVFHHAVLLTHSFEWSGKGRFPSISDGKRSFRLSMEGLSRQEDDAMKPRDHGRRNLFLGSAVALGSALWGCTTRPAKATTVILEESEARRIDIFERNAPSVVFIDTFVEKQDVFSPNVMEVPLGSGSGFVWDRDGHIGRLFVEDDALLLVPWMLSCLTVPKK